MDGATDKMGEEHYPWRASWFLDVVVVVSCQLVDGDDCCAH